jgi:hypothetical protein
VLEENRAQPLQYAPARCRFEKKDLFSDLLRMHLESGNAKRRDKLCP